MTGAAAQSKKLNLGMIMAIYLFGIFMGAIDTGIVTPARTIIQNNLMVDDKTGIWMITIYTLAYAASIPVMGKLADRYGRKYIYILSIFLFGLGSLFCGLSEGFGSFTLLLAARCVQAIGGGGIMPVATAEFGTIFPPEKRGMALGLVGGVYGIANIFGSSIGSAILNLFGNNNWQFIFYVNLPISLFVIAAGFLFLPNTRVDSVKKIDAPGILLIVLMVLSLLYGLRNIDFFNFRSTFLSTGVYPYLIAFVILLPLFILVEKKAEDPVMNLGYFVNVPQFSENALRIATGSGGYFVIILGVFAGVGAPFSGRLTDRFGPKLVLIGGFLLAVAGSLFLMFVTIPHSSFVTVFVSLMLTGLGVGFTMGAPLNYMMLSHTRAEESNSALATLSLVRSIGTAIAPAIMVGFIAHAGGNVQGNIMNLLPKEVTVPPLPYSQELSDEITKLKNDPNMKEKLSGVTLPDLKSMTTVKIDMKSGDTKIPDDLIELMKTSDVTNITARTKTFSSKMFDLTTPAVITKVTDGVQKGIDAVQSGRDDLSKQIDDMTAAENGVSTGLTKMQQAQTGIDSGLAGLNQALSGQKSALEQMNALYVQMTAAQQGGMPPAGAQTAGNLSASQQSGMPPAGVQTTGKPATPMIILDMIPPSVKSKIPQNVLDQLKDVKTPADLKAKIDSLQSAINTLETKISQMQAQRAELTKSISDAETQKAGLDTALSGMKGALSEMDNALSEMQTLKDAVPGAFKQAESNYLNEIQKRSVSIENTYQSTLNDGFWQIYFATSIFAAAALVLLILYRDNRKRKVLQK